MAAFGETAGKSLGFGFLLGSAAVYEIIAFMCSSPQTAELNIQKREKTLMKYVHLGQGLSAVTVGIAALIDKKNRFGIVIGGAFGMVAAETAYIYARNAGLANPGPMTEDYGPKPEGGFVYG